LKRFGGRPSSPVSVGHTKAFTLDHANRAFAEMLIRRANLGERGSEMKRSVASGKGRASYLPWRMLLDQNSAPERWGPCAALADAVVFPASKRSLAEGARPGMLLSRSFSFLFFLANWSLRARHGSFRSTFRAHSTTTSRFASCSRIVRANATTAACRRASLFPSRKRTNGRGSRPQELWQVLPQRKCLQGKKLERIMAGCGRTRTGEFVRLCPTVVS